MIETRQAVENIREIVTVPGISGLFVGPSDLSFALGVPPGSPAAERSLAELNLRGVTGATVLAILREGEQVLVPSGHEVVHEGDVLAVAGSNLAIEAARALMDSPLAEVLDASGGEAESIEQDEPELAVEPDARSQ